MGPLALADPARGAFQDARSARAGFQVEGPSSFRPCLFRVTVRPPSRSLALALAPEPGGGPAEDGFSRGRPSPQRRNERNGTQRRAFPSLASKGSGPPGELGSWPLGHERSNRSSAAPQRAKASEAKPKHQLRLGRWRQPTRGRTAVRPGRRRQPTRGRARRVRLKAPAQVGGRKVGAQEDKNKTNGDEGHVHRGGKQRDPGDGGSGKTTLAPRPIGRASGQASLRRFQHLDTRRPAPLVGMSKRTTGAAGCRPAGERGAA